MKTKDFIKMLQEEDPTGESHVRLPGGVPTYVEQKPGYYDGAYSYIDDGGNFVTTTKGYKIDVYAQDLEDFIWSEQDYDLQKIKFDEDLNCDMKAAQRYAAQAKECTDNLRNGQTVEIIEKLREGWKVIGLVEEKKDTYNQLWFIKDPKKFKEKDKKGCLVRNSNQSILNCGMNRIVRRSGLFLPHVDEKIGLMFWKFTL
jgi:hypothetical protein